MYNIAKCTFQIIHLIYYFKNYSGLRHLFKAAGMPTVNLMGQERFRIRSRLNAPGVRRVDDHRTLAGQVDVIYQKGLDTHPTP